MNRSILTLILLIVCLPVLCAQAPTHPWNEQLMSNTGNYGAMQMGYEFEVLTGGEVPEVVQLGAALPINTYSGVTTATVALGKAKVTLWEVDASGTTGTLVASADVDPDPNWAWKTLPSPVTLTPGKRYRVCVLTKVVSTLTVTATQQQIQVTDTNCYFFHSGSLTPLTAPTGTIQFTDGCLADNGTWPPSATESMFPDQVGAGQPWGMADIGWRPALVSPVLAGPVTLANVPGVLITEAGPDVASGGHEGGEIQNVSAHWQDLSGWKIVIYDGAEAVAQSLSMYSPLATGVIPQGTALAPGQIFTFGEAAGAGAFDLAFGSWNWATNSASAVLLLNAQDQVVDLVKFNSIDLTAITTPVGGLDAFWTGAGLAGWNTTNTWQRGGNTDYDSASLWARTNGRSVGAANQAITTPFPGAGRTFATLGGTDPAFTATLQVGQELKFSISAFDGNQTDALSLTISYAGGLDPAQAGFTNLTAGAPVVVTGGNNVQFTLDGVAAAAGVVTLNVHVADQTARSDTYTIAVTINSAPNFAPLLALSYDTGTGRTPLVNGATLGTSAQPVAFGSALSAFALQVSVVDGNSDAVAVTGALSITPVSAQAGMAGSDFSHAAQAATYMYSPVGGALFAHLNATQSTFTVTLTASDGNGGTCNFVLHFVVAAATANALPAITVTHGGAPVTQGGNIVVGPNDTLAGLLLQIAINDANNEPVRVTGGVSNVTSQGLLDTEFSTTGYVSVAFVLAPGSGLFNVPGVIHTVTLTADDGHWLGSTQFSFQIVVNRAPSLSLTAGGAPVASGTTLVADYLDTLASLAIVISVNDADGNPTAVSATVGGVSSQGFGAADFSAAAQAVTYWIQPASGSFNAASGSSHLVTLTATDSYGGQCVFVFTLSGNPFAPVLTVQEQGGAPIANGDAPAGGRDFGTVNVVSGPSAPVTIELGNSGSGPLLVQAVTISGANASDFTLQAATLPASISPATTFVLEIRFAPQHNGLKQASVNVQYQGAGSALNFVFHVRGTGLDVAGPRIDTPGLPDAVTGAQYPAQQLQASGGAPAYTWSLLSGALPNGLALSATGEISGTALTGWKTGGYAIVVRLTDSLGATDERAFSFRVIENPSPVIGGGGGTGGCAAQAGSAWAWAAMLGLLGGAVLFRRGRAS